MVNGKPINYCYVYSVLKESQIIQLCLGQNVLMGQTTSMCRFRKCRYKKSKKGY